MISIQCQEIGLWELIKDHQRENALIFYQILLTHSLKKYIRIRVENLYVDIGVYRVWYNTHLFPYGFICYCLFLIGHFETE